MNSRYRYSCPAAILLGCCAIIAGSSSVHAQTTIGSSGLPARAALLDLKTRDAINPPSANDTLNISSIKGGLILPRVKLVDRATLEPFIAASDPDWQNNSSTRLKEKHAGMMVYNINGKPPFVAGTYTWNGSLWMASHRPLLIPGHGLALDGRNIQAGEELSRPVSFDTDVHQLSINGSSAMTVAVPVRLGKALRYTGSASTKSRVIMSDADGNAAWEENNTLPVVAPVAKISGSGVKVDLTVSNTTLKSSGATIQLPKGRWIVMVTMLATVTNGSKDGRFWMESSFYKNNASALDSSIFVGNNISISGLLYDNYNIISGFVVIENNENKVVSYTYKVNRVEVFRKSSNGGEVAVNAFGSENAGENSIVAFALVP